MKKLLIIALIAGLLVSCTSSPSSTNSGPEFEAKFSDPYNDGLVKLSCVKLQNAEFGQLYTSGRVGVYVQIESVASQAVLIKWDQSSIDFGKMTDAIFLDGQKYVSAGEPAPSQPVMPGKSVIRMITGTKQVFNTGGPYFKWLLKRFPTYNFTINLCVSVNKEDRYYPLNIVINR